MAHPTEEQQLKRLDLPESTEARRQRRGAFDAERKGRKARILHPAKTSFSGPVK